MGIIQAVKLAFEYKKYGEDGKIEETFRAVDGVDLDVRQGDFVAILGHNGSGKSTLAKQINAILTPTEGTLYVDGMDTAKEAHIWDVRQTAGMVFQNPDNQIIGTVVEEDVGFGPENMGVPTDEIWERVGESLKHIGMWEFRKNSPNKLSGGQKQRVAIAGVLAMQPKCIVLDEPTAMLDPIGRMEVIRTVRELNRRKGVTVLLITHYMEEVIHADKVIVMDQGKIVMQGTPTEIFAQTDRLKAYRLDVPQVTLLAHALKKSGIELPECVLDTDSLVTALCRCRKTQEQRAPHETQDGRKRYPDAKAGTEGHTAKPEQDSKKVGQSAEAFCDRQTPVSESGKIRLEHVGYVYSAGDAFERKALDDICLEIPHGQFVGVIGHTGSGKSTLMQHLNGLLRASEGAVYFDGEEIGKEGYDMRRLRGKVGLVFQYPEHQLFETDVFTDVCFGPKNLGLSQQEIEKRAREALRQVGMAEKYDKKSPFELSGGQKRRVAIAGVLAMHPDVLVLDEPTAGLDPKGRDEILDQIARLQKERSITVILVSHSMEDVAKYVDRIIVMDRGKVRFDDTPENVFQHDTELEEIGLAAPQATYVVRALEKHGWQIDTGAVTAEEAAKAILQALERQTEKIC